MIRFLVRRALHAVLLIFVIITATFILIRIAPGDPLTRYYSPDIDPRAMDVVRRQLGLEDPLPIQYIKTLRSYLLGDFGMSIAEHRPVADIIRDAIPRTLQLTGFALVVQLLLGLVLGVVSAAKRDHWADRFLSVTFLVFYSTPSFYLAFIAIAIFALELQWLPSAGLVSIHLTGAPAGTAVLDRLAHMVLPVGVLALGSAAAFARYTRGSMLDVIREEYVRTARAKGLGEGKVVMRHVFKNALPQILTVVGLSIPFLLGGAVVIEKVFAWPGMGALLVDSIFARDYPVVLAVNFIAACTVILGNLLADLSYGLVDPRIKVGQETAGGSRG